MKNTVGILMLALSLGAAALAQKPNITNARVQESSAAHGLKASVDSIFAGQTGPLWVGYRIPAAAKDRMMCCWDSVDQFGKEKNCCAGCRMDSEKGGNVMGADSECSPPEPLPYAFVFLRAESKQITKVRVFSAGCPLDFAGLPFYWLNDVRPEQSVELLGALAQFANEDGSYKKDLSHQAVMAIAMHDVPAADQALEKLIQPNQPVSLRGNVAFWLGVERGRTGLQLLRKYAKDDQDDRFREKITFAISQSKEPDALKDLIGMARNDSSPRVRGQAIFWLAQIGGRRSAQQITSAIENDPDTQVKKKAVFALSQLHDGEGVPLLINVARSNRNAAVRKQAIFWLGQSHDPRALDFLEEILTK